MKIGDKILVTYSNGDQVAGRIYGETTKSWKVEFDVDGDQRTIRKTMDIEVIDDPVTVEDETSVKEVVEEVKKDSVPYEPTKYTPSKKVKRGNVIILVGILLVMAAIGVAVVYGVGIF